MLKINQLTKTFGSLKAVNELSFEVPDGEIVGFVGSNGAGKSTTMRISMGVLSPTSGSVTWNGQPIDRSVQRLFGYMPEERGLYPKMKVGEQLNYLARLHGLDAPSAKQAVDFWTETLGVKKRINDEVQKLSLGNQQRVQLAAALVFSPEMLILDEPFSGLDPVAVEVMSEVLLEQSKAGIATLFSSHQLDLVERLCDRVVIIREGQLITNDTVQNIKSQGTHEFQLSVVAPEAEVAALADRVGGQVSAGEASGESLLRWDGSDSQGVLSSALQLGQVQNFGPLVPTLTELFREVVAAPTAEETEAK
ncbi:ABC transporter ATP-binding protein [Boudabousia liubingyangii]|uniref:ABC transporter ATP-binding protein n=1 Tax=Boudabousia liubingyangii TaxID=1921764 RepID=UPI000938C756|nr:ATP-binding cassette domain-containing protein [Boudabousia liubingyangii]OKL46085.1 ABC transporter ATP-binding protein [Boudabousia liubingyangii]